MVIALYVVWRVLYKAVLSLPTLKEKRTNINVLNNIFNIPVKVSLYTQVF